MDFLDSKSKTVKLRSHLDKYLVADADGESVRQSRRSANSPNARWTIESVKGKENVVRLKSCHGSYLMASDTPFLLGVTGKKALLMTPPDTDLLPDRATAIEWEPIRDGFQVRLRTWGGKYLTANGGMPPWRNSITHDDPRSGAMHNWILWDVEEAQEKEIVRKGTDSALEQYLSSMSSFSSVSDEILSAFGSESGSPCTAVARMILPRKYTSMSSDHEMSSDDESQSGIDFFRNAKVVRLRSRHGKYLVAGDDLVSVSQNRSGTAANARWTVEFVLNSDSIIRLKSCCGKYLTASDDPYPLRMTGFKVLQTRPSKLDSSVEWDPIREGNRVKLRTRYGNFLRGNGSVPPWRNSVTHDIPRRTTTRNWVLWEVEVVDVESPTHGFEPLSEPIAMVEPEAPMTSNSTSDSGSQTSVTEGSISSVSDRSFCIQESIGPFLQSSLVTQGRTIYYHMTDDKGEVEGEDLQGFSLHFKGSSVRELTQLLEQETGIRDAVVCSRSPLNGKLCPLRLQLPPNVVMHVVVAPSSLTELGIL